MSKAIWGQCSYRSACAVLSGATLSANENTKSCVTFQQTADLLTRLLTLSVLELNFEGLCKQIGSRWDATEHTSHHDPNCLLF
ncbi:hypothetical protein DPMN_168428 [Dreissena polymorpha]|uniref:Uncharacterized protein n=1 Tax=Dreissena polymorpha TaxID=45954 RepID=A0A9D4F6G3_DREPO|nr:hypothetical protein DPMN_168428 [Dreissena polymorpha]